MTTTQLIYEGKAKKIYSTTDERVVVMEFKNSLTAFNALKKGEFDGKGQVNCEISTLFFSSNSYHLLLLYSFDLDLKLLTLTILTISSLRDSKRLINLLLSIFLKLFFK